MKKIERITKRLKEDKEISKHIANDEYYTYDQFISDAQRYIKAIKQNRMICSIDSVSKSGMSRTIKFLSCEKSNYNKNQFNYLNYFAFFRILGYSPASKYGDYFRIFGCGMDMIFDTNYTNIHRLHRLGFISKKECDSLAQQTPIII